MQDSDATLWLRILDGDQAAWKQLIRRYQPLVYTVTTRAGLSLADAADCFQQTFISLFENRHKIEEPSRLSAWLTTTAKRESLRVIRSRRQTSDIEDHGEIPDTGILPDEELEQLERQSQLEVAIKALQERCRTLISALFFSPNDLSYQELAEKVGIAVNSLGPIRQRCLERLKQILKNNEYPDVRNEA